SESGVNVCVARLLARAFQSSFVLLSSELTLTTLILSRVLMGLLFCRFVFFGLVVMPTLSFFFSSRRRHTRLVSDWSSDVCSSDLRCQLGRRAIRVVQADQLDRP